MYRPVLLVSYALNYAVGEYDVFGYHLVNLVIHLANAWLVWLLAGALLSQRPGASVYNTPTDTLPSDDDYLSDSTLAALLFTVHPVMSEPVNYISSRSSLLATFFSCSLFCCWRRPRATGPLAGTMSC